MTVWLSDTVLMSAFSDDKDVQTEMEKASAAPSLKAVEPVCSASLYQSPSGSPTLPVSNERLTTAERADPTLKCCFERVGGADKESDETVAYFLNKEVLLRKWAPSAPDPEYNHVYQVVVPSVYCQNALSIAHESKWSGHLGMNKAYKLVIKHFFWPGLKSNVAKFCRSGQTKPENSACSTPSYRCHR